MWRVNKIKVLNEVLVVLDHFMLTQKSFRIINNM